jgi:hypothetical protein
MLKHHYNTKPGSCRSRCVISIPTQLSAFSFALATHLEDMGLGDREM